MKKLSEMTLAEIRRSWANDFLTTLGFASYYGISVEDAEALINLARKVS